MRSGSTCLAKRSNSHWFRNESSSMSSTLKSCLMRSARPISAILSLNSPSLAATASAHAFFCTSLGIWLTASSISFAFSARISAPPSSAITSSRICMPSSSLAASASSPSSHTMLKSSSTQSISLYSFASSKGPRGALVLRNPRATVASYALCSPRACICAYSSKPRSRRGTYEMALVGQFFTAALMTSALSPNCMNTWALPLSSGETPARKVLPAMSTQFKHPSQIVSSTKAGRKPVSAAGASSAHRLRPCLGLNICRVWSYFARCLVSLSVEYASLTKPCTAAASGPRISGWTSFTIRR
mmetsp:Transcript_51379/g.94985  ORF Transcript_51379/g.94985 Transcript_51379/m.94985 type:complete len:301 (+) Transcript_51379:265-1167(+)